MNPCPPKTSADARRFRPTWAEVSVGAYASNLRALSRIAAPAKLMAVLKADAYGHGAAALAPVALECGVAAIGVSSIEEGIALRDAGIGGPILLLGSVYPLDNYAAVLEADLTPTVSSLESVQALARAAAEAGRPANFHLKIDTGMARLGVSTAGARAVLDWTRGQTNVRLAGVYSHFASADADPSFTAHQLAEFLKMKELVSTLGFRDVLFHIANSAATITLPASRLDLVRPGIASYGLPGIPTPGFSLAPVLAWKSSIVFQKRVPGGTSISYGRTWRAAGDADIATVPVGYADGVPRQASGRAVVLVKGQRRPVVGRVTMDHIMVDVTGTGAGVGDEVGLIGEQGKERLTADDWAAWAGTISYDILTGISKRVPRVVTA